MITLRASELDRVLTCNGSLSLVPLVAPRESDEGYEGTAIHDAIARRLIRDFGAVPPEDGLPAPDVPPGYTIPKNATWIVDWCIRHVQERVPADWTLMVELGLAYEFTRWTGSGHFDFFAISPCETKAIGGDYKSGRDPVDPADHNEQVGLYLALAKRAWPQLAHIEFDIVQPRVSEEDGFERISTVVIEGERLERLVATLDARVCAALDNAMELNSGRKQCKWCPAKLQCDATIAEREFMKVTLTPESLAAVKRVPDDQQVADWVAASKTLAKAMDEATEIAKARIKEKGFIAMSDGTQITAKEEGGAYKVPDPRAFLSAVRTLLPTDDDLAQVVTFSQTRIKDRIAEVMNVPKTGKAAVTAESVHAAHLRPLVEQGVRVKLVFSA